MLSHALTALALTLAPPPAPEPAAADSATYRIDVGHSDITFRIRHLMSRVTGTFNEWQGAIAADPADWSTGSVDVTIQAASIDTRHTRRDEDLKSGNFFDVANWPTITFRSTSVEVSGNRITVIGDLTMRGVTKPVTLEGEFLGGMGMGAGPGKERVGFSAEGTIDRTDYGVTWNRALEGGGALLGDEVEISLSIEAIRM